MRGVVEAPFPAQRLGASRAKLQPQHAHPTSPAPPPPQGEALKANITTLGPLVLPVSEQLLFAANFVARKASTRPPRPRPHHLA